VQTTAGKKHGHVSLMYNLSHATEHDCLVWQDYTIIKICQGLLPLKTFTYPQCKLTSAPKLFTLSTTPPEGLSMLPTDNTAQFRTSHVFKLVTLPNLYDSGTERRSPRKLAGSVRKRIPSNISKAGKQGDLDKFQGRGRGEVEMRRSILKLAPQKWPK